MWGLTRISKFLFVQNEICRTSSESCLGKSIYITFSVRDFNLKFAKPVRQFWYWVLDESLVCPYRIVNLSKCVLTFVVLICDKSKIAYFYKTKLKCRNFILLIPVYTNFDRCRIYSNRLKNNDTTSNEFVDPQGGGIFLLHSYSAWLKNLGETLKSVESLQ